MNDCVTWSQVGIILLVLFVMFMCGFAGYLVRDFNTINEKSDIFEQGWKAAEKLYRKKK